VTERPAQKHTRTGCFVGGLGVAILIGAVTLVNTAGQQATQPPHAATPAPEQKPQIDPIAVAVTTWITSGGINHLNAISGDLTRITQTATVGDTPGINTACHSLQTHVEAAQAYSAIPDQESQNDWATALAQAARAASDCIAGTDTINASLITKSGQELEAATTAITAMNTRIRDITPR
jgi:hypothetical protein